MPKTIVRKNINLWLFGKLEVREDRANLLAHDIQATVREVSGNAGAEVKCLRVAKKDKE